MAKEEEEEAEEKMQDIRDGGGGNMYNDDDDAFVSVTALLLLGTRRRRRPLAVRPKVERRAKTPPRLRFVLMQRGPRSAQAGRASFQVRHLQEGHGHITESELPDLESGPREKRVKEKSNKTNEPTRDIPRRQMQNQMNWPPVSLAAPQSPPPPPPG